MVGSLEKKHQHVSIIFKTVPDIANHRLKAIRRINPGVLQCSFVPSLFDNMISGNNNPSNEDAGKACAYITKCDLMWVRRSSRLKESKARRMHYGACGSLAVRVEAVYLCRWRSGSHTSPHSITHPARYACHGHSPDRPTHFSTARSPPQTCCGPYPAVPMEMPQVPIA